jgi:rhodanese-related sulfurtransferase
MTQSISPEDLTHLLRSGKSIELIDVRTPAEFESVHLEFARNVPLERLDPDLVLRERPGQAGEPIYVICQKGGRGIQACAQLTAAGFFNVVNVEGGTIACEQAGLPVVRGATSMSLERQVRIAAGSLVVLSAALGLIVHPYWNGIALVVGAGLVFAGITDTCGMGVVLARMPWNRSRPAPAACDISANHAEPS